MTIHTYIHMTSNFHSCIGIGFGRVFRSILSAQAAGGVLLGRFDNIIMDAMDLDGSPGGWEAEVFGRLEEWHISENSPEERGRRG